MSTVPAAYAANEEAPDPAPIARPSNSPLITYRIEIIQTKAVLRVGLLNSSFRYEQNARDAAEFSSIHQAAGVMNHAQKRLNDPFGSVGAVPLAQLSVVTRRWADVDSADVYDAGIRIKTTAIEAALLDLEGAPACLAAVKSAREERWS